MIVRCSIDEVPERNYYVNPDGTRGISDGIHRNDVINISLVASFKKEDWSEPAIAFAFTKYVFGNETLRWKYESREQRDADFEKIINLVERL